MSAGRTPGSPPSPSSRIAVARVSAAPKRTTSQPSSREIDATPGGLGGQPQLGDLDEAQDGRRHRAEAVGDLLAERGDVAGRPRPGQPPVELQLLGLLGDVVVGQVRVDRQVDDRLRRLDDRARGPRACAFCSSTASASSRE